MSDQRPIDATDIAVHGDVLSARLWIEIERRADHFGAGIGYRSDLFLLLAAILAYYKARGTEPQDMISDTMLRTIDNLLEAKP